MNVCAYTIVVHDSGRTEYGQLYFSMELMRGETLKELMRRERRLGIERVVGIARQMSEAHGQTEPIVHEHQTPAGYDLMGRTARKIF